MREGMMQIFVRADRTRCLRVPGGASVAQLKAAVEASHGWPAAEQRLVCGGRQLEDGQLLAEAGVGEESTVQLLGRLRGGAKKRKKKTYTKPKKQKHKHKKVKLRVLKLFKVDDSGKVQRLRKQCPTCGNGINMATHFNRVYCGQCHLTFMYDKEAA